eukprot:579021-Amorphochlora_amoeboformis.AAC.1
MNPRKSDRYGTRSPTLNRHQRAQMSSWLALRRLRAPYICFCLHISPIGLWSGWIGGETWVLE